jgi:N-acyl-phosphatidylethanolamine-hydrolysing phospholipase D
MAKKLFPLKRNGRFYFDAHHRPESLLFGTIPSFLRTFFKHRFNKPVDPTAWVQQSQAEVMQARGQAAGEIHAVQIGDTPQITWLGHATFLIQIQGINILTDPVFEGLSFMHPRMTPCGIAPDKLPEIHVILISHNHRDHLDKRSLLLLKKLTHNRVQVLVPLGDKKWFLKHGFAHVQECDWEQEVIIASNSRSVICTFVPAHHWSARGLFDKNKSLWGGWVIQERFEDKDKDKDRQAFLATDLSREIGEQTGNSGQHAGHTIYFAGDTAYSHDCFARIKHLFPRIDIALIPIGPGEPREWMRHSHVDAQEAGQAFLDVGARCMVPMHWGTFAFGNDKFDMPLLKLQDWWAKNSEQLVDKQLQVLKVGQRLRVLR